MTFGETDAYKNRPYLYTFRTASRNTVVKEVKSKDFILFLRGHGMEKKFRKWQKMQDQEMINRLAFSVYTVIRGMNIDGANSRFHEGFEAIPKAILTQKRFDYIAPM